MAFVLCIGVNEALIHTRKLILQSAGHTVIVAHNESGVANACSHFHFDVCVIGQAAHRQTKREFLSAARKHCNQAKVLEVYLPVEGIVLQEADDWLEAPALPEELSDRVTALAKKRTKRSRSV